MERSAEPGRSHPRRGIKPKGATAWPAGESRTVQVPRVSTAVIRPYTRWISTEHAGAVLKEIADSIAVPLSAAAHQKSAVCKKRDGADTKPPTKSPASIRSDAGDRSCLQALRFTAYLPAASPAPTDSTAILSPSTVPVTLTDLPAKSLNLSWASSWYTFPSETST